MKENILLVFILFYSIKLYGQSGHYQLSVNDSKYYSLQNAELLIKQGKFVQVVDCGDFRNCLCIDSISKKYNFIRSSYPFTGCIPLSKAAYDTIIFFNNIMFQKLSKINGVGWKNNYDLEVVNCSESICCKTNEIDSFLVQDQFYSGILFDYKDTNLKRQSKCILDNTLIKNLIKYPSLKIKLIGKCTFDEGDSINISGKRVSNVMKYLMTKGISKSRISIENNGWKQGWNNPKDNINFTRKNRVVIWTVTAT
jgi:hypothetical protein